MTEPRRMDRERVDPYAWYALGVMLFTYIIAFIDRQAINLLVDPIKADLHLSDTQVSLLQGFAFALVLSLTGLPIGRLIDVGRRTTLLARGAAVWSVMTLGCGISQSYSALLAARAGVGAGESVMTPSALSLIGDYFPVRRLGFAISIYALGVHVGTGLALLLTAQVLQHLSTTPLVLPLFGEIQGWRLVFVCMALPGFVAALWVASLREPARSGSAEGPPPWSEVFAYLRSHARVQLCANAAVGFMLMTAYGIHAWSPSFLIRHFEWSAVEAGLALGPVTIVSGVAGVLTAGALGDCLRQRGIVDARWLIMAAGVTVAAPLIALAPRASLATQSVMLFGIANYFSAAAIACGPAILQELSPPRMRGVTHALAVLCVNLLSLGLGPLLIAAFTDHVLGDPTQVGLSLGSVPPVLLACSLALILAGRKPFKMALAAPRLRRARPST